jgi:hypothetical protein
MTLPNEAAVAAAIATQYRAELDAMTGLHDAVVSMMSAGKWTFGKRGIDRPVVFTMLGLLVKACKTFRSVQILCERGLMVDANALVRVLMENIVAIAFILQSKPRERARICQAHAIAQDIKMLNHRKSTPGLKRKVTKQLINQANEGLATWTKGLPAGTDFKHHWSGRRTLQEAMKALRGDVLYATLYVSHLRYHMCRTSVRTFKSIQHPMISFGRSSPKHRDSKPRLMRLANFCGAGRTGLIND